MSIEETLNDRSTIYGDFEGGIILLIAMMDLIQKRHLEIIKVPLNSVQEECIRTIINKITRIAVTPNHVDSWRDIEGYARLVKESIERRIEDANK